MDNHPLTPCVACPDPALCRRMGLHVVGRLWQLWTDQAKDVPYETRAAFREALGKKVIAPEVPTVESCPFDRIYLLNLTRRPDRLEACRRQLQGAAWPWPEPLLFPAVDGSRVPTPVGFHQGSGAWGCLQSHRQLMERCLLDEVEHVLILEDDFVLRSDFPPQVREFLAKVPADAEGLFLGGQHHLNPVPVGPGIVRCINTQRTHAYSATRRWQEELYKVWCSPQASVHCDWLMGPMCGRFKIYAPDPFLIGQRASHSDICGRDQPAKFWQPPSGREPIVVLRAEQPVVAKLREVGWHTGFTRDPASDYDVGLVAVVNGHKQLRAWIDELMWEVVSEENWLLAIWHPAVKVEAVRAVWAGPVLELYATCAGRAVGDYRRWLACLPEGSASA